MDLPRLRFISSSLLLSRVFEIYFSKIVREHTGVVHRFQIARILCQIVTDRHEFLNRDYLSEQVWYSKIRYGRDRILERTVLHIIFIISIFSFSNRNINKIYRIIIM